MKNLFCYLLFTFLLAPLLTHGQGLKGSVLTSGSVSYSSQPVQNQQGSTELGVKHLSFQPMAGFFFHDRWAAGALVGFSHSDADTPFAMYAPGGSAPHYSVAKLKSTTWEVGAFTRYYHPFSQRFFLVGQLTAGYSSTSNEIGLTGFNEPAQQKRASYFSSVSPHLTYLPLPWLGLELGLGAVRYQQAEDDEGQRFTLDLNPGNLKVGLSFYLGRALTTSTAE